jgi:prepilin-type N-terminal cleavage/methylation domain-containing protein
MLLWQRLKQKNKHGFTLVEILVAVTLSVLLISGLYAIYITSYKSYRRSVDRSELTQNARISLERITRDLRQTSSIVTVLPPAEADSMNPPPSTIKFVDGHDTTNIQYVEYSLEGNNLMRKIEHYSFTSAPDTWVSWDSKDQYGNLPIETVDENVVKADKIKSLKFFGSQIIYIKVIAGNNDGEFLFNTQTLGRNIQ